MIFPEQVLKNIIDLFLDNTIDNFIICRDRDELDQSYLHDLFGKEEYGYDYFENAIAIFTRDIDHPRKIEVHKFFNRERFNLPTIHIGLPNEQISTVNGIGYDQSYMEEYFQPKDPYLQATTHSRMFRSKYNIVFTSDNTHEVLIMYNWFKSCMIGNIELFELNGLHNPIISGNDIVLNNELAPNPIYSRAIYIDCIYEITAPNFNKYILPSKIEFDEPDIIESDDDVIKMKHKFKKPL
jgi:hypothetical protein